MSKHLYLCCRRMFRTYHVSNFYNLRILSWKQVAYSEHRDSMDEIVRLAIPHTMRDWPEDVLLHLVKESFRDKFANSCGHDFDCCGCWSSCCYSVKRVDRRTVIAAIYSYQNI